MGHLNVVDLLHAFLSIVDSDHVRLGILLLRQVLWHLEVSDIELFELIRDFGRHQSLHFDLALAEISMEHAHFSLDVQECHAGRLFRIRDGPDLSVMSESPDALAAFLTKPPDFCSFLLNTVSQENCLRNSE